MKKNYLSILVLSLAIAGCKSTPVESSPVSESEKPSETSSVIESESPSEVESSTVVEESSPVVLTEWSLKGTASNFLDGKIKNFNVSVDGNPVDVIDGEFTATINNESEIVVSKGRYISRKMLGADIINNSAVENITYNFDLAAEATAIGFAAEAKTWSNFGDFMLSASRDATGIRAILKSNNVSWIDNANSRVELYVSTGLDTAIRNASTFKISYSSNRTLTAENYNDQHFSASLFKTDVKVTDRLTTIDITIPYDVLGITNEDIIGLTFGEWTDTEADWCPMKASLDEIVKAVESPSNYVRIDKYNLTFNNKYNCYVEDNPAPRYDKEALTADYPISFAKPGVAHNDADDIYVKCTTNENGFIFDMIGFGTFADNEFIRTVIHKGSDNGSGWAIKANDLSVVSNKETAYTKTNSTYFWDIEHYSDATTPLTTAPTYNLNNDGYWTYQLVVLFEEIPGYDDGEKYSVLFVEFGDQIYNNKWDDGMSYNRVATGDAAVQSSYVEIQSKVIEEHQSFEEYPIKFATTADYIYANVTRDYDDECLVFEFGGYNPLADTSFIRLILTDGSTLANGVWALNPADVSFTIYKDAAYYQTGVNSFWANETGKEKPFINDTAANSTTIYTPEYTYNATKGYFTLTFKVDFSETGIASITNETSIRGILIEFAPAIIGGNCFYQNGVQGADPAIQANYLVF